MIRKALTATVLALAALAFTASGAFGLDCVNVSRPAPAQPEQPLHASTGPDDPTIWVVQGDWWFISFDGSFADGAWDKVPPGTGNFVFQPDPAGIAAALGFPAGVVNGNYQGGQGFGLLDIAQAPCNASRQTQHGIQAESVRCS